MTYFRGYQTLRNIMLIIIQIFFFFTREIALENKFLFSVELKLFCISYISQFKSLLTCRITVVCSKEMNIK